MIPGMNPRQVQAAMKKLGMKQEDIGAYEVIIKTHNKNLLIKNPQVSKINMMGQETIQVTGNIEEEPVLNKEDIKTVAEQAGVSQEKAMEMLDKHKGDLAAAILELQNK